MSRQAAIRAPQFDPPSFKERQHTATPLHLVKSGGQQVTRWPNDTSEESSDGADVHARACRTAHGLPTLLTCSETALFLRRTNKAIYALVERRQIPVVRIGRRLLFRRDSLIDWIRQ